MAKRDGWVLVGEAYVYLEGIIMDGEAVADYSTCFERLSIV